MIEKENVVFDRFGQWSHSAVNSLDEKFDEMPFQDIPAFEGLELLPIRVFDADEIELLCGSGFDAGPADFRKWEPDAPKGDGWFPFIYSDDEDGPYVLYARQKERET